MCAASQHQIGNAAHADPPQGRLLDWALTDPLFNPVCLDSSGAGLALPGVTDPAGCGSPATRQTRPPAGARAPRLTRGGSLFQFHGRANINEYAVYASDAITLGHLSLTPGLRVDQYNGLTSDHRWSRASASPTTSRRPGRSCAPPIRAPSRRLTTRTCCFRARPAWAGWPAMFRRLWRPVRCSPGGATSSTPAAAVARQQLVIRRRLFLEVHG